jgi:sec-independent protein translocase protein TatB
MFDISWSELLILGVVTLVFVGPKELPVFLRTLGKYFGMMQRQAAEFRAQFDEAMREAELDQMKKEVEAISRDVESRVREADKAFQDEIASAKRELDSAAAATASQPRIETKPGEPAPSEPATPESPPSTPPEPAGTSSEKSGG